MELEALANRELTCNCFEYLHKPGEALPYCQWLVILSPFLPMTSGTTVPQIEVTRHGEAALWLGWLLLLL